MRATTLLRRLLAVYNIYVTDQRFEPGRVIVSVRTRWDLPRCSGCSRPCRRVHDHRVRLWRHHDLAGSKVFLEYRIRRVKCRHCKKTMTEAVPWAAHDSGFTRDFEERVAYFAQNSNQTFVGKSLRISWRSVGRVVRSVVHRTIGSLRDRVKRLRNIGVDEISYRKHHEYITTVVDHDRGVVIWMGKGKSARRQLLVPLDDNYIYPS